VIAAHLGLLRQSRRRQAKALVHAALHENERPTVLLGDLNEWRVGRRSALQALDPVFGPIHAVVPSFPSRYPVLALDRILANPSALISDIRVHNTPTARVASDHLPVKAWITLRR
jgi:endonuclease/exonuclease/phosphatase family metal-dependent hydrolase